MKMIIFAPDFFLPYLIDKTDGNDTLLLSIPNTGDLKDTGYHQLCIAGLYVLHVAFPRINEANYFIISHVACKYT